MRGHCVLISLNNVLLHRVLLLRVADLDLLLESTHFLVVLHKASDLMLLIDKVFLLPFDDLYYVVLVDIGVTPTHLGGVFRIFAIILSSVL